MPHNLEAEQRVLSCFMMDADATVGAYARVTEADFYSPAHKTIFNAIRGTFEKNIPVDFVTVVQHLTQTGKLDTIGGLSYLTAVAEAAASSANFRHYLGILRQNRILRKLITASNQIIEASHTAEDAQAALATAEKAIFDISREDERRELTQLGAELPGVLEKLDTIQRDPMAVRGLQTGFFGLDRMTNGLQKSDLIIIAARPSVGKTSLGLNILLNTAIKKKAKVAIFSLEMSKQSLAMRALCSVACVSLTRALKGELDTAEWRRVWEANKRLGAADVFVDDNSVITPAEISRKCMRLKREHGLDLVMIDYLGLMGGGSKRESRQVEVADNSRMIKIMAKELDVPVILLSQLNRGIEARKGDDAKPVLSDLRESGAIEQDADIVMFIHKAATTQGDSTTSVAEAAQPSEIELIIAKHRNGPLGTVKLKWVPEFTSFMNNQTEQSAQDAIDSRQGTAEGQPAKQSAIMPSTSNDTQPSKKKGEPKNDSAALPPQKPLADSNLLDVF